MFTPKRRFVVALALVALAVSGCSAGASSTTSSSAGPSNASVVAGLVAEPASLDFTTQSGAAIPQVLMDNIYETLVSVNTDGKIVGKLAKSWTVSPDNKTYTFQLVSNATFSNGDKLTADDVVNSINNVKTKWTVPLAQEMSVVASAAAPSATEVVVTLATPSNGWLYNMTTQIGAVFDKTATNDLATSAIGSGPYTFTTWNRGDSIVLTRNDKYWGKKPYYKTVTLKYFTDPTALNNALLSGAINIITTVQAPESLGQFTSGSNASKYEVIQGTTTGEVVMSMNESNPYLKDVRVRQAIRDAIDHKALLDTCWAGKGTLIGSMAPPTDPWYQDRTGDFPYDPAKAKELLKEAGATNITLRLRLPSLPYATACGPVVQTDLAKVGIKVVIDSLTFPAAWLSTVFTNQDYDMSIIAHTEPRDTPTVFGQGSKYYTNFQNADIDPLLKQADEGSPADQIKYMQQAEKLISTQAAADFLFLLPNLVVADKGITGIPKNSITEALDLANLAKS